jgi:hypothetical protein
LMRKITVKKATGPIVAKKVRCHSFADPYENAFALPLRFSRWPRLRHPRAQS